MLTNITALLGRSIAATAFGGVQSSNDGAGQANRHAAHEIHQDYAKRGFRLDIPTTSKSGDVVDVPSYLTDTLAELDGAPPAELQRFIGLLSMTFSKMGHDQEQVAEMLGELMAPVVEAMNLGEEFRPELIAAALVQRSIAADVGEPPGLVDLANSLHIEIKFAGLDGKDGAHGARPAAIEHIEIRSDLGIKFDLDKALFADFPEDSAGKIPTLRNLLDASTSVTDHQLTDMLTGPGGEPTEVDALFLSEFGEKASDFINVAMTKFRNEANRVLEAIGIDSAAIADTLRGLAMLVRDALENGTNLTADLSVIAASQTTISSAAGEFQSLSLSARSIHVVINHDTGEVAIDTSSATFEKQTLTLGGAESPTNLIVGTDLSDLLEGFGGTEDIALRQMVRNFAGDDDVSDHGSRPEITIKDVRPDLNLSGERITSFTMDFMLRFGVLLADDD